MNRFRCVAPLLGLFFCLTTGMWWMREVRFTRDANGRIDGFLVTNGRVQNLRFGKTRAAER